MRKYLPAFFIGCVVTYMAMHFGVSVAVAAPLGFLPMLAQENIPEDVARAFQFWGSGSRVIVTTRVAVNPASVAAEASGDTTFVTTGALLGDYIDFAWETDVVTGVNAAIQYYVSAADTSTVHLCNGNAAAGAAIDIASTTIQATVRRRFNS